MSRRVITIDAGETIATARDLFRRRNIRQVPVLRRKRLVGIVTDRDLRIGNDSNPQIADVMTPDPLVISPDASVDEAARILRRRKINALPVVDRGRVVGILTTSDVLDAFVAMSGVTEPTYRLSVSATAGSRTTAKIRELVQHNHGEIKWIHGGGPGHAGEVHIRVKAQRVDDIETALEAAGFEVLSVVSSTQDKD
jgi:acetoin utilization protein AcuB